MTDILEKLRRAHKMSVSDVTRPSLFGDAAKEIERLSATVSRWSLSLTLVAHTRLSDDGLCSCGHQVPLGAMFTEHQADALMDLIETERALSVGRLSPGSGVEEK